MALSPGGKILACALSDGSVELWQIKDGKLIRTLKSALDVDSLAFSPDSQTLIALWGDTLITSWHVEDGSYIQRSSYDFPKLDRSTVSLVFAPDSHILATANALSRYGTISFWRLDDSWAITRLRLHNNDVRSIAFSPDNRTLASVSSDRTVRLWRIGATVEGTPVR